MGKCYIRTWLIVCIYIWNKLGLASHKTNYLHKTLMHYDYKAGATLVSLFHHVINVGLRSKNYPA